VIAGSSYNYGADDYVSAFGEMFNRLATKTALHWFLISSMVWQAIVAKFAGRHSPMPPAKKFLRKRLARARASRTRDSRGGVLAR